jgi:hypothetical protein
MTLTDKLYDLYDNVENILNLTSSGFDLMEDLVEATDSPSILKALNDLRECLRDIEAEAESAYDTIGVVEG